MGRHGTSLAEASCQRDSTAQRCVRLTAAAHQLGISTDTRLSGSRAHGITSDTQPTGAHHAFVPCQGVDQPLAAPSALVTGELHQHRAARQLQIDLHSAALTVTAAAVIKAAGLACAPACIGAVGAALAGAITYALFLWACSKGHSDVDWLNRGHRHTQ